MKASHQSDLGRELLQRALKEEGLEFDTLSFTKNAHGKPFLENYPEIYFNISHSKDLAGCVISDKPIGLDIENRLRSLFQEKKEASLDKTAKRCFSEREWEVFSDMSQEEKVKYFLECWTKKESYSKAKGLGMTMDFRGIDTEAVDLKFYLEWRGDYCLSVYVEEE